MWPDDCTLEDEYNRHETRYATSRRLKVSSTIMYYTGSKAGEKLILWGVIFAVNVLPDPTPSLELAYLETRAQKIPISSVLSMHHFCS
jgi:hypothetical protein